MTYTITAVSATNGFIQTISHKTNQSSIDYTISRKDFVNMILGDSTNKPSIFTKNGTPVYLVANKFLTTDPEDTTKDNLSELISR